jgi:hypothetical protein
MESEMVEALGMQKDIDTRYFSALVDAAIQKIAQFGDVEEFIEDTAPLALAA